MEKYNLHLLLPKVLIKKHRFPRVALIKFLDVLLDEHLSQKDLIKYIKNKFPKHWIIIHSEATSK